MRAMVLREQELVIDEEAPRPGPGPGQVLARVRAAGICGSDLHAFQGARAGVRALDGVIMGHEFVAEVVAAGPGADAWTPGTRVVSYPAIPAPEIVSGAPAAPLSDALNLFLTDGSPTVGYSARYPGGFGEYLVLSAPLLVAVPDGVPDEVAATTEPCAVGLHAVHQGRVQPDEQVLIMGAGPIGLMVLLWLKRAGVRHVAVSDRAAVRRELATRLGADLALDPARDDIAARLTESAGGPPPVVFECVGVEGTLQEAIDLAAREGRVIVVGVCNTEDRVRPRLAIGKHLTLQFVLAYTVGEVREALAAIADGSIDTAPLVTRTVSLDELPTAFAALNDPRDCKVMLTFP